MHAGLSFSSSSSSQDSLYHAQSLSCDEIFQDCVSKALKSSNALQSNGGEEAALTSFALLFSLVISLLIK